MNCYRQLRPVMAVATIGLLMINQVAAHGLVEDPPSRNWFCGAITKPDHFINNVAEYEQCEEPFNQDFNAGYNFMSVLTHAQGRSVVDPLPANVCGFDSESFGFGETIWDYPTDWPTSNLSAGRQEFLWNISWGPHFDDTEEFKYWITKPDFQFSANTALSWSDFEEQPFCSLAYDDSQPSANPDVIPLPDDAKFRTFCTVPEREGRHVIYAEWGRNQSTFERFHGCIDVVFGNGNGGVGPTASLSTNPSGPITGSGSMTLDGSGSSGSGLNYSWTVEAPDDTPYTLQGENQAIATLTFSEPNTTQTVTVALSVSNTDGTDRAEVSLTHGPSAASQWTDLGPLTNAPETLVVGDRVSLRVVTSGGQDRFIPAQPITVNAVTGAADEWPQVLAQAVNGMASANIAVGLVDPDDNVFPVADAVGNRIYYRSNSDVNSVFLIIERRSSDILLTDGFE